MWNHNQKKKLTQGSLTFTDIHAERAREKKRDKERDQLALWHHKGRCENSVFRDFRSFGPAAVNALHRRGSGVSQVQWWWPCPQDLLCNSETCELSQPVGCEPTPLQPSGTAAQLGTGKERTGTYGHTHTHTLKGREMLTCLSVAFPTVPRSGVCRCMRVHIV